MIAPTASPLRARREEGARAFDRSRGNRGTQRLSSTLEAIFLATFVLISQKRAEQRRVLLADTEWHLVQAEGHQNEQL
jgi:hypothetical protein